MLMRGEFFSRSHFFFTKIVASRSPDATTLDFYLRGGGGVERICTKIGCTYYTSRNKVFRYAFQASLKKLFTELHCTLGEEWMCACLSVLDISNASCNTVFVSRLQCAFWQKEHFAVRGLRVFAQSFLCLLHHTLWYNYTTQTKEMHNFLN
jgi:hypothetical protein